MNHKVNPKRIAWKVSIIGAKGSGKSSLISRIVYDTPDYTSQYRSLTRKVIEFQTNGERMKADILLQELDPASNSEKLLLGSNAIVVTIDITDEASMISAEEVLRYVTAFEKEPSKFIVATKLDRKYEAKVWDKEFDNMANKYNTTCFKTSSKTADGISEFLDALTSELSARFKKRS